MQTTPTEHSQMKNHQSLEDQNATPSINSLKAYGFVPYARTESGDYRLEWEDLNKNLWTVEVSGKDDRVSTIFHPYGERDSKPYPFSTWQLLNQSYLLGWD